MLDVPCWTFLAGRSLLDVPCWTFLAGRSLLDVPCWTFLAGRSLLDVPCWMFLAGRSLFFTSCWMFDAEPINPAFKGGGAPTPPPGWCATVWRLSGRYGNCSHYLVSGTNSRISPGWQSSAAQSASSVLNRIAFALPVFKIDKLARVISTRAANSVRDILRRAIITSRFTIIAMTKS
jgi:hypothetical protein